MKRYVMSLMMAVLMVAVFSAGAWAETIKVAGAGGMISLVTELAKAYTAKNPNDIIEVNQKSIETKGGIMQAAEGKVDIGMAARKLKKEEETLVVNTVEIARVAVVIGVNKSVAKVSNIKGEQLCKVYEGKITNWKELGGDSASIIALTRPDADATKDSVRKSIACFKELAEPQSVAVLATSSDMTKVLTNRTNTIGFTDTIAVEASGGSIIPISLDGVAPTNENVVSGKYKVVKNFVLLTKGQPAGLAKKFIDFIKGTEGEKIIKANKAVPVK